MLTWCDKRRLVIHACLMKTPSKRYKLYRLTCYLSLVEIIVIRKLFESQKMFVCHYYYYYHYFFFFFFFFYFFFFFFLCFCFCFFSAYEPTLKVRAATCCIGAYNVSLLWISCCGLLVKSISFEDLIVTKGPLYLHLIVL